MNTDSVYADKLVEITDGEILFRYYYFPFGSRRVKFSQIDHVVVKKHRVQEILRNKGLLVEEPETTS